MKKMILTALTMVSMLTTISAKEGNETSTNEGFQQTKMVTATTTSYESEPLQYKSGFGVKGGIGLTSVLIGDDNTYNDVRNKMKVGGFAAVSYEKRFTDVFALDVEAGYANKGVRTSGTVPLTSEKLIFKVNTHQIEVPVSMKFYVGDNFNINFGPYVSFIAAAKAKLIHENSNNEVVNETKSVNMMSKDYEDANGNLLFNRVDFGANLGVEYISDKGIGVGARVNQGFRDLINNDYAGYMGTDAIIPAGDNKWSGNTGIQVYGIFRF
ncbi:MAG: PorT family protein [Chitinophagales bacterium]|nr:PorT family protein [Chitinophagales bacterium]